MIRSVTEDTPTVTPCERDYVPLAESRDEMSTASGATRSYWRPFFDALAELGRDEFDRRWDDARRLVRENGITYNVYGDPRGLDRPLQLDPIPLLIPPQDAKSIESGLVQRANLLEQVLADLYGPQRLLADGLIPPELVYDNHGFLRACRGLPRPSGRSLLVYGADIARTPDGRTLVLADRAQNPSGSGYALENRIVLSRMLPEVFAGCRVQRLALFFRTLRDMLKAAAPHNRDNPRIVLLTPGPYNDSYFEHAYLARYLGFTLVEGGDLTVRDERVFLKVLGGLQPVDVILRRLDDDFCDPLELRADSFLGVPGLVQAVRAGNVAVANPLGSGLVDSPAFAGYLPALCRRLLGEDLRLPSPPTWWCGEPAALEHVIANLSRMVIKPIYQSIRFAPVWGERLDAQHRSALVERLRSRPRDFVGQERFEISTAPVMTNGHMRPRHIVTRAYLAAEANGFVVMPGGLTYVTGSAETMNAMVQRGEGSKDTWVLASGPVSTFSLLPATVQPVELSRGGFDLPSRTADNLYWLGRYVERAEGTVRLMRGILVRVTERPGLADAPELPALLRTLTTLTAAKPGFVGGGAEERIAEPDAELRALLYDPATPGSLAYTLNVLHRAASTCRDRLSEDMWRILGGLKFAEGAEQSPTFSDALELLNRLVIGLAAFGGMTLESMTRSPGWRFLDLGRRLERCLHSAGLLRQTLGKAAPVEGPLLEAVLEVADSLMTYRRRYLSSLQTAPVLDLLLADEANPRSLAFQLAALADHVDNLPRDPAPSGRSPEQRIALSTLTAIRLADAASLSRAADDGRRRNLDMLLETIETELPRISDILSQRFFTHLQTSRHLESFATST